MAKITVARAMYQDPNRTDAARKQMMGLIAREDRHPQEWFEQERMAPASHKIPSPTGIVEQQGQSHHHQSDNLPRALHFYPVEEREHQGGDPPYPFQNLHHLSGSQNEIRLVI
jgi:hypothetical protein